MNRTVETCRISDEAMRLHDAHSAFRTLSDLRIQSERRVRNWKIIATMLAVALVISWLWR